MPSNTMVPFWGRTTAFMQLSMLVLPAPLGPIMPRISPRRTSKETFWSATVPPKLRSTSRTVIRTSSLTSANPGAPHASRLRPVLAALAGGPLPEVELLDHAVGLELVRAAFEHDPAGLHDVGVVG